MYIVGGFGGSLINYIEYALLVSDGSIGEWHTTNVFTIDRLAHETVIYNQYMYVLGGLDKTFTTINNVQYAGINSNGSLANWQTTTSLPTAVHDFACVAYNGYIYCIGGNSGTEAINSVQYAAIASDGSLGAWSELEAIPVAVTGHTAFCEDGYMYTLGGYTTNIFYTKINDDGTLNEWQQEENSFNRARGNHSSNVHNNNIYIIGGSDDSSILMDIEKASF